MTTNSPTLIVVLGPTASGKTALGVALEPRRETWFRRMERQWTPIVWLPGESDMVAAAMQQARS